MEKFYLDNKDLNIDEYLETFVDKYNIEKVVPEIEKNTSKWNIIAKKISKNAVIKN